MNCLLCGQSINDSLRLTDIVFGNRLLQETCCQKCKQTFKKIGNTHERCQYCLKNSSLEICEDCQYWKEQEMILERHRALFEYNESMSEFMTEYKYKGQKHYATIFRKDIAKICQQISYDLIVPMPLSKKRLEDRGFHHIETLLDASNVSYQALLHKKNHTKKQATKTREERLQTCHKFYIKSSNKVRIKNKTVLLMDDVYTTGSTILSAKRYLISQKAKKVITFTLSR